jgi:O-antigen/teichoic acid export membrane protein
MSRDLEILLLALSDDSLEKKSSLLFIFALLSAFLGYAFQVVLARQLSIADFGSLNSLLALLGIVAFPSKIFQTVIAKISAEKSPTVTTMAREISGIVCFAAILFAIISPFVFRFLKLDSFPVWSMMTVLVFLTLSLGIPWGYLQGRQEFLQFGLQQVLLHVTKLIFGVLFIFWLRDFTSVLFAINLSVLCSLLWAYRNHFAFPLIPTRQLLRTLPGPSFILFLFYALSFLDLLLAKHFLAPEEAGIYAAVAIFGKGLLSLSDSVLISFLPIATTKKNHPETSVSLIARASAIQLVFFAFGIGAFYFFGEALLAIFGKSYHAAAKLLPLYGLAMLCLSLAKIPAHFWMARDRHHLVPPLLATLISQVVLVYFHHESIASITRIVLLSFSFLLVYIYIDLGVYIMGRRPAPISEAPRPLLPEQI